MKDVGIVDAGIYIYIYSILDKNQMFDIISNSTVDIPSA